MPCTSRRAPRRAVSSAASQLRRRDARRYVHLSVAGLLRRAGTVPAAAPLARRRDVRRGRRAMLAAVTVAVPLHGFPLATASLASAARCVLLDHTSS